MPLLEWPFKLLRDFAGRSWVWLGLPLLLHVPTLFAPFAFDDLHLVLSAEAFLHGDAPSPNIFDFGADPAARRAFHARGNLPWWVPSNYTVAFSRPLAEWSACLDVYLFGRLAACHRLVSLAWLLLALLSVHALYRALDDNVTRAGLATLLFGLSQALGATTLLVANRADLLTIIGATNAARLYVHVGRSGGLWRAALAATAIVLTLLAKETGVAAALILFLDALLPAGGLTRAMDHRRAQRALGIFLSLIAAAYVLHYAATHPARLSAIDWATAPSLLAALPRTLGLYASVWTLGFPVQTIWFFDSPWHATLLAVLAGSIAVLVAWHLRHALRTAAGTRFVLLWLLVSLLPATLTVPEPRALALASVGWTFLLTHLLLPAHDAPHHPPSLLRHGLLTANGAVQIVCMLLTLAYVSHAERSARNSLMQAVRESDSELHHGDTLIFAAAHRDTDYILPADRLEFLTGRRNVAVAYLTRPDAAADFSRLDDHTLRATSESRSLFRSAVHRVLLGDRWQPHLGQQFHARDFTAEVARVQLGAVTTLTYHFDDPLTSPRLHFAPASLQRLARKASATNN